MCFAYINSLFRVPATEWCFMNYYGSPLQISYSVFVFDWVKSTNYLVNICCKSMINKWLTQIFDNVTSTLNVLLLFHCASASSVISRPIMSLISTVRISVMKEHQPYSIRYWLNLLFKVKWEEIKIEGSCCGSLLSWYRLSVLKISIRNPAFYLNQNTNQCHLWQMDS